MLIETLFQLFRVKGFLKEQIYSGIIYRFICFNCMFIITEGYYVIFILELLNARVSSHAGTGKLKILISP